MNIIAYAFKDLKAQKVRTILGIFGISVSIFLLSTVSFLTDSVSASYVDFLTVDSGNIDMDIYQRYVTGGQENVDRYFNYTEMSEKIENVSGENIKGYIPRVIEVYSANISESNDVNWFYFVGLNLSYEEELNFGEILPSDYDFVSNGIPQGNCAISEDLAFEMGLKSGDIFNISRGRDDKWIANQTKYMNLTICAVFTVSLKFPAYMDEICLVEIEDIPFVFSLGEDDYSLNKTGKSNHLLLTLTNSDQLYDVRDIDGSERKMESIGSEIQLTIGYNYWVDMPKLDDLDDSELISLLTSILFVLIGLISMLISIILITGIISTAVEERIREFGIFRCLGAHKSFNLNLVLFEGILICIGGTTLGILMSIFTVSVLILPLVTFFVPNSTIIASITFVVKPITIISIYSLGVTVGIIVSISPAIKVMRMEIVQAINPYRHEENLYKLVRESKVNLKIVLVGILLAVNGGVVFFLIPRLFLSLEISLLLNTFIIILLVFLIGLTMAGVGIMPIFLRFWIAIFTPFFRRLMNIIKVTIFRHQRRNLTTILMFCLSFSFVIFSASEIDTQLTQFSALVEFNRGSELIIYRSGTGLYNPTTDIQHEIMQVEGIESSSKVIANPDLLTEIYAADGKTFSAEIGDHLNFKSSSISLFGIDSNYQNAVYSQYIDFTQGNLNAFEMLNNGSDTCIISEALSLGLSLNLDDTVRLTFNRGDEQSFEEFIIVGIADKLPGFPEFRGNTLGDPGGGGGGLGGGFGGGLGGGGNQISVSSNGVLISQEKYIEYMSIPNPAWIDKIFIKLIESYSVNPAEISEEIEEILGDRWDFYVFNVPAVIADLNNLFNIIEIVLLSILSLTIIICMFGLFSSSYSSILERKREIGILRALGLKKEGISVIFTVESLIIMLGAGSTGTIVGFGTAALMSENLVLFSGSPRLLRFPWLSVIVLFVIATTVLLIGMKILLRRVKSKNLIQIFRETT